MKGPRLAAGAVAVSLAAMLTLAACSPDGHSHPTKTTTVRPAVPAPKPPKAPKPAAPKPAAPKPRAK